MRTSLLCLGVATLLTSGTLMAQRPTEPGYRPAPKNPEAFVKALMTPPVEVANVKGDAPSTQTLQYQTLWTSDFFPLFETFNSNNVFLYEKGTGTLALVRNNRTFDSQSNALTGGQVRTYFSTDQGATWGELEVFNKLGTVFAMPNMAISNPGNSATSPAGLVWSIYGFTYEESVQWNRTSSGGIFKTSGAPFDIPMEGPDQNNNQGFTWNVGSVTGVSGDNPSTFFAGVLGNGGGGQYGTYGAWGFDFNAEDFTASTIPSAWDNAQFRPSGAVNSSYNSPCVLGSDDDGTLYMVVNNIWADNENLRCPAVSTSNDQGATWSAFNRMPESAFDAYRATYSWDNIQVSGAYDPTSMVVTGPGKLSFFFRAGHVQNQQWANLDIVEARYDNGTWTLARVAELNGFPLSFTRNDDKSNLIGQYAWVPTYELNPQGHEVEVAITADGQDLLVKWIDENPDHGYTHFSPPQPAWIYDNQTSNWVENQFDSMLTTDAYYTYRSVSAPSWNEKKNMSNDMAYDHGTRIPQTIPDLEHVPFLTLSTIAKADYNQQYPYLPALQNIPDLMLEGHVDYRTPNRVKFADFNAKNLNSVAQTEAYQFSIEKISPNPANDAAQVAFTMDVAGSVKIDVISTSGASVNNVFNGSMDAGIHAMNVNTANLASGAYFISVSVNGKVLAQPLSIIK